MTETETLRLLEAILFASTEPLDIKALTAYVPEHELPPLLSTLKRTYTGRGVELVERGGKWAFRTAPDLAVYLGDLTKAPRKLSRTVTETLAIIAYHQPVSRAEIEQIRGTAVHRGVLDVLLELDWIKPGRRRNTPGRPMTWVTTPGFLDHFSLSSLTELPGLEELKANGLLDTRPVTETLFDRLEEPVAEGEAGY